MNWTALPLNTSKLYIQGTLYNGCKIYVPIKENATQEEQNLVRIELHSFILRQQMSGGDLIA